jgi:anti-sigma factor ChrR (cupin superfamily)
VALHALAVLPPKAAAGMEAHVATCRECHDELEKLRSVIERFVDWPLDDMKPPAAIRERVARRISEEIGRDIQLPGVRVPVEPEWEQVSPGIWCQLLSTDVTRNRVSMLVRLAPNVAYPAHTHTGVEELHLLDGELWIDDRKLIAGDYNRAEPGSADERVWSETGCTCVLITSPADVLR